MISRVQAILWAALMLAAAGTCAGEELISSVPDLLRGQWVAQMSRHEYSIGCTPATLLVGENTIIEHKKFCGQESRRTSEFEIHKVLREEAWLSSELTFTLVCSYRGIDGNYSWSFKTLDSSKSIFASVTGPSKKGHRVLGNLDRPQ